MFIRTFVGVCEKRKLCAHRNVYDTSVDTMFGEILEFRGYVNRDRSLLWNKGERGIHTEKRLRLCHTCHDNRHPFMLSPRIGKIRTAHSFHMVTWISPLILTAHVTYECHHMRHGDASVPAGQKSIIGDVEDDGHTETIKDTGTTRVVLEGHAGSKTFQLYVSAPSLMLAPVGVRTWVSTVGKTVRRPQQRTLICHPSRTLRLTLVVTSTTSYLVTMHGCTVCSWSVMWIKTFDLCLCIGSSALITIERIASSIDATIHAWIEVEVISLSFAITVRRLLRIVASGYWRRFETGVYWYASVEHVFVDMYACWGWMSTWSVYRQWSATGRVIMGGVSSRRNGDVPSMTINWIIS